MVVVDPPFVTEGVWESYSETTKLLLKKGYGSDGTPTGKVILTTLAENADMLKRLLSAEPTVKDIAVHLCRLIVRLFLRIKLLIDCGHFCKPFNHLTLFTFPGFPA